MLLGLYPSDVAPTGADAVRRALSKMDFSWLKPGDSVLLKIAANSGRPHPATTSPEAVRGVAAELFERGAGRVIVGEQSGVEWVRGAPGTEFSSTEARVDEAGILAGMREAGAEAHFFEAQGFDAYFEATPPSGSHWAAALMLPNVVREVDHIIYLPRLSAHGLAGYTTGHKLSVGWLREDSRNHLHHQCDTLYEKYVEINYVHDIASRLRMVVTLAEAMLLDFGPDEGTVHRVDPRMVIASQSLANHEAVAVGAFLHANVTYGLPVKAYSPLGADNLNQIFTFSVVPQATGSIWGPGTILGYAPLVPHYFEQGLSHDRAMTRAWEILGGRPESIGVVRDGAPPSPEVASFLETHSEGMLIFV